MAASVNQDFVIYRGDDANPIFTVRNASGQVVDISTVSQIVWSAQRNMLEAVAVTKSMSTGGVVFVTNGTDGQFRVLLNPPDTSPLDGFYIHRGIITDSFSNVTSVEVGRMQVGPKPTWTWDPGSVGTSRLYQVRSLIGDVLIADQLLTDEQINWINNMYGNIYFAAAEACRQIASMYARQIDIVQGQLKENYSNRTKAYRLLAFDMNNKAIGRGAGAMPYVGGISVNDKITVVQNQDRVPPQFNLMMYDNLLPVSPVGNQTPSPGIPEITGLTP
jgi:hypothetical protein